MSSTIGNMKNQIKTLLDTLVVSADLASVIITDFKKNQLDGDVVDYPCAFIYPPSLETSEWIDNKTSVREYTFDIMVMMQGENTSTTSDVEDLMETIMNKLENDITLNGYAHGGITPITSRPEAVNHAGKSLIVFDVIIKAKALNVIS